jgi:hypothetical protein
MRTGEGAFELARVRRKTTKEQVEMGLDHARELREPIDIR